MPSIRELVDQATSESAIGEDWSAFLALCDLVDSQGSQGARECVLAISKRVPHRNPNVALLALSLTESLVKNCARHVQREIASRQFTEVLVKALASPDTHPKVKDKIRQLIEMCVQEYQADPMLGYMADVKTKLVAQGHVFVAGKPADATSPGHRTRANKPKATQGSNDDEEAKKIKEKEDLELAIALSLSEHQASQQKRSSMGVATPAARTSVAAPPPSSTAPPANDAQPIQFHVRALYDFPGTDRGELPFRTGDVIAVTDADYDDWWEGTLRGKSGLIPSNYVERLGIGTAPQTSQPATAPAVGGGSDAASLDALLAQSAAVDSLLATLATLDPRTTNPLDHPGIQQQYRQLVDLRPALVGQLTAVRAKKERVLELNDKLTRARATYDRLMDEAVKGATAQAHWAAAAQPGYGTAQPGAYGGVGNYVYGAPPNSGPYAPGPHGAMGPPPPMQGPVPVATTGGSAVSNGTVVPPGQPPYANWSPPAHQQAYQQPQHFAPPQQQGPPADPNVIQFQQPQQYAPTPQQQAPMYQP